MNPKAVAGITGCVGLAVVGLIGRNAFSTHSRAKRDLLVVDDDDQLEVDDGEYLDREPLFDEWSDDFENGTDLWRQFNKDIGVELSDDDVQPKQGDDDDDDDDGVEIGQRSRKRGKGINWNKMKESQLKVLGDKMREEWGKHMEALSFFNEISGISMGGRDPSDFGSTMDDEGDYAGYDKTAPIVTSFLEAFNCKSNGKGNFGSGKTNVWALFPGAVPLFSADGQHLSDWAKYWEFFIKFAKGWPTARTQEFRFSIGSYSTTARFTPRGYKHRHNTPFSRMQKYYKKPQLNAARPKLFSSLRSVLTYLPRYGVSTSTAGDNCVLLWFFQDVPRDLNDFLVPEEFEMITELHTLCTVIPIIVAPNANDQMWKDFAANLMPGLQERYAKDPDYNGVFHVESFAELDNADLMSHINNYLCLVENRATCRIYKDAWKAPVDPTGTDGDPTEGFRAVVEDYDEATEPVPTSGDLTTAGTTVEATTKKTPEIDSCCGHDGSTSTPFDSELKTCCEDGAVRAYEYEGDDPCLQADFFK